jgi:hypothetical protein
LLLLLLLKRPFWLATPVPLNEPLFLKLKDEFTAESMLDEYLELELVVVVEETLLLSWALAG